MSPQTNCDYLRGDRTSERCDRDADTLPQKFECYYFVSLHHTTPFGAVKINDRPAYLTNK